MPRNNLSDWNGCKVCGDFRLVIASAQDQSADASVADLRMACANGHGYGAEAGEWLSIDLTEQMIGPRDQYTTTTVVQEEYGYGVGWGFDTYVYEPMGWGFYW